MTGLLSNYLIGDSETLGLRRGSGYHQFALYDPATRSVREWWFNPNLVGVRSRVQQDVTNLASSALDQQEYVHRSGDSWLEVARRQMEMEYGVTLKASETEAFIRRKNPFLYETLYSRQFPHLTGGYATAGESVARRDLFGRYGISLQTVENQSISEFVSSGELTRNVQGKTLWFQNTAFECVGGDTLVQLADGDIKPIAEVSSTEIFGTEAYDGPARIVIPVITKDPINKGLKHTFKVSPVYGLPTIASDGHLWFTDKGWKRTDQLTTEDWLLSSIHEFDLPENLNLTDDELSLVGWFIAEGRRFLTKKNADINITCTEAEYRELLPIPYPGYEWRTSNGKDWRITHGRPGEVNLCHSLLRDLGFEGKYAWNKSIPSEILKSSNRQLGILIASMWCGDGHIGHSGPIYTTTSKLLAEQIVLILQRLGIWTTLILVEDNRKESYKTCYRVTVPGEAAQLFLEKIPIFGRKLKELEVCIANWASRKNHRSTRRVPVTITPDWKSYWEEYARKMFSAVYRHKFPYRKLLRSFTDENTDGVYQGDSISWSEKAFEKLAPVFGLPVNRGVFWTQISCIEDVGEIEVWDIETNTGEFLANGLVVHNSKQMGAQIAATGSDGGLKATLETASGSPDPFYVTGVEVNRARVLAQQTGDWTGVYRAYVAHQPKVGETAVRDIMDVTRAVMSYGRNLGLIQTNNDYFGQSIDLQHRMFAAAEGNVERTLMREFHGAAEDAAIHQDYVLRKSLQYAEALEEVSRNTDTGKSLIESARRGTGTYHEAIQYFKNLETLAPDILRASLAQRFERAHIDLQKTGTTYQTAGSHVVHSKQTTPTGAQVSVPRSSHDRIGLTSMSELLDHLKTEAHYSEHGIDLEGEMNRFLGAADKTGYVGSLKGRVTQRIEQETAAFLQHPGFRAPNVGPTAHLDLPNLKIPGAVVLAGFGLVLGLGMMGRSHESTSRSIIGTDYQAWLEHQRDFYGQTRSNQGMQDSGVGGQMRRYNTDFGSPYRGPMVSNQTLIDQELLRERERQLSHRYDLEVNDPVDGVFGLTGPFKDLHFRRRGYQYLSAKDLEYSGSVPGARKNMVGLDLRNWNVSVEDADTIVLKKGGVRGAVADFFGLNRAYSFRLAGLDAPETYHGQQSYHAPQPRAEASKAALASMLNGATDAQLYIDPGNTTYGRMMGMVVADGKNVNFDLIRQGWAAALPFGKADESVFSFSTIKGIQEQALAGNKGIWQEPYFLTYKAATDAGGKTITFNTFTKKESLAGSSTEMSLLALMEGAQATGNVNYSEAEMLGRALKAQQYRGDFENPSIMESGRGISRGVMYEQFTDLAEFTKTHGTGTSTKNHSRGNYGQLNSYMALDSMNGTTSPWGRRRLAAYEVFDTRKQLADERRYRMMETQQRINQTFFNSPIGHQAM